MNEKGGYESGPIPVSKLPKVDASPPPGVKIRRPGMKVNVRLVGMKLRDRHVEWREDWPPPRVGEPVYLLDGEALQVRSVAWYPEGDREDHPIMREPFVHVVVGLPGL